tara:strand:+ start:740 stop:3139 length:2400 start_codon:yes stop_codon:yes gene_type:complete
MAEEIVLEVKSNISTVTKDVDQLSTSLETAQQEFSNLNEQIQIQKSVITELELEYIRLQQLAVTTPRTASAGYPQLIEKIRETKTELALERIGLKELNNERRSAKNAMKDMNKGTSKYLKSNTHLIGSLTRLSGSLGGIKSKYLQIIPAAKKMFFAIKAGMISTGIGALVVALGLLVGLMSQSDQAASTWNKTMTASGAMWDVLTDRMGNYADAWYDVFTGDWEGVADNLNATFNGISEEMERQVILALTLKESQAALAVSERELSIELANKQMQLDELNRAAQDENATQEQKIQSATDAYKLETEMGELQMANASAAIANLKIQIQLEGNEAELLDSLATAEVRLINLRRTAAGNDAKFSRKISGINKKAESQARARHSSYRSRAKQKLQIQIKLWNDIQRLQRKHNEDMQAYEFAKAKTQRENQHRDALKELDAKFDFDDRSNKKEEALFEKHQQLKKQLEAMFLHDMMVLRAEDQKRKRQKIDEDYLKLRALTRRLEDVTTTDEIEAEKLRVERKIQADNDELQAQYDQELKYTEAARTRIAVLDQQDKDGIIRTKERQEQVDKYREGVRRQEEEALKNHQDRVTQMNFIHQQESLARGEEEVKKEKAQAKELADYKIGLLQQGFAVISQGLDAQSAAIEKNYKEEKKLAEANGGDLEAIDEKFEDKRKKNAEKVKAMKIGMAIIDTFQAANAAYNNALTIPIGGLALAPIAAALAVASGLANVAMIMGTDVGSGGGGGAPGGLNAPAAPPAPEMMSGSFELEGGQEVEPMQAYVVSDDITNSQDKLATIRRRATI